MIARQLILCLLLGWVLNSLTGQQLPTDNCVLVPKLSEKAFGITPSESLWPNGIVPYVFNFPNSSSSQQMRDIMEEAFVEMNALTNTCWIPSINNESRVRIDLSEKDYNHASVGYTMSGGYIAMVSPNVGVALHEMAHVLGMWHEQQRPDRDNYVRVLTENIDPKLAYNFDRFEEDSSLSYSRGYDYASIMHYSPYAYSINGKPTITDLNGNIDSIGGNGTLTNMDIYHINSIYPGITREACAQLIAERDVTFTIEIMVSNATGQICENREATLTAMPSRVINEAVEYYWTSKYGTPSSGFGTEFNISFASDGEYQVELEVRRQDAKAHYSYEVKVAQAEPNMRILGNPVPPGSPLQVEITAPYQDYSIQLIDMSGRRLYQNDYSAADCTVTELISTERLPAGVYYVMYVRGRETFGKRVVLL